MVPPLQQTIKNYLQGTCTTIHWRLIEGCSRFVEIGDNVFEEKTQLGLNAIWTVCVLQNLRMFLFLLCLLGIMTHLKIVFNNQFCKEQLFTVTWPILEIPGAPISPQKSRPQQWVCKVIRWNPYSTCRTHLSLVQVRE